VTAEVDWMDGEQQPAQIQPKKSVSLQLEMIRNRLANKKACRRPVVAEHATCNSDKVTLSLIDTSSNKRMRR
jgi:hypothetical protein